MDELKLMRFEIEGLGRKIAAMVVDRAGELDHAIEVSFKRLAESGDLQRIVDEHVANGLGRIVSESLDHWTVREAIREHLVKIVSARP